MAIGLPFTPLQAANGTAGLTVKVTANATPTSVSGSLALTSVLNANNIRVYNSGTKLVFVRVSAEATPSAAATDIPLGPGEVRIVQSPVSNGTVGLAALSSTTTACDVYFTPGEGGT
jgi:hypothetical protein